MKIETGSNCIIIDGRLMLLKGSKDVVREENSIKILSAADKSLFIEIESSGTTIDGDPVTSLQEVFDYLKENLFRSGGGDGSGVTANNVGYSNITSGLSSTNVQGAIDESVALYNSLGWAMPNYPTDELPEEPSNFELAFDIDEGRIKIFFNGNWVGVDTRLDLIQGYDPEKTQVLKNILGEIQWVDEIIE